MVRPDSIFALEDEQVLEALLRYVKVVKGELPPKFQIAKRFEVDLEKNLDFEQLLEIHRKALPEFLKIINKIDTGELSIGELSADRSLLDLKIEIAEKNIEFCEFCERKCRVDRKKQKGFCRVGYFPRIASHFVHLGEEPWITPSYTVFFTGCNLRCVYCQNWDISQYPESGEYIEPEKLAKVIDNYRRAGVRNVNWVGGDPTPNTHYILKVLRLLHSDIPVVWNSNAYESEFLHEYVLSGIVDVYLFDFKYYNESCAVKYSSAPNYFKTVSRNYLIAIKYGEISCRHLVLPNHVECCSKPILKWIAENLGRKIIINIMSQYRPEYKAYQYPEINRRITDSEYQEVLEYAEKLGLNFKAQA